MIPGKKPQDDGQHDAMLRRLGIAEERPAATSRWDLMMGEVQPMAPVQTPPPAESVAEEALPIEKPILMTEAPREAVEPLVPTPVETLRPEALQPANEPVAVAPVEIVEIPAPELAAPEPTVAILSEPPQAEVEDSYEALRQASARFMAGWGEESIPEEEEYEEAEAFFEPEAPAEAEASPSYDAETVVEDFPSEPEAYEPEARPVAEVVFLQEAITADPVVEPMSEPELTAAIEAATAPLSDEPTPEAMMQVRAELDAIREHLDGASAAEAASATPVVVALLQLTATLLDRTQRA